MSDRLTPVPGTAAVLRRRGEDSQLGFTRVKTGAVLSASRQLRSQVRRVREQVRTFARGTDDPLQRRLMLEAAQRLGQAEAAIDSVIDEEEHNQLASTLREER